MLTALPPVDLPVIKQLLPRHSDPLLRFYHVLDGVLCFSLDRSSVRAYRLVSYVEAGRDEAMWLNSAINRRDDNLRYARGTTLSTRELFRLLSTFECNLGEFYDRRRARETGSGGSA